MSLIIDEFAQNLHSKNLQVSINLERPSYVQPEDRVLYRSTRIILILGMLNISTGLSKEIIACVDFLLRNPGYQKQFIVEYFKEKTENLSKKLESYNPTNTVENDLHIVQYKSVPWDLRFNDMFLFLHIREFVQFVGEKPNLRVILTDKGKNIYMGLSDIFIDETNFLSLFGKRIVEGKATKIITEVIPNTFWRENEKFIY